jgi:hypothetical protein
MKRRPAWLEWVRGVAARAAAGRRPAWSLVYSVLFLTGALIWARLPHVRPTARRFWMVLLITLAVNDFASAVRRLGQRRALPPWTWVAATLVFALLSLALAFGLTRPTL